MLNGSHAIDKSELARRAREAREQNKYTQLEVAHNIGVGQNWVSQVELQKLSLHEDNLAKVKDLAKNLGFEVPYVSAPKPVEAKVLEMPKPVTGPVPPEPKQTGDLEIDVIRACSVEFAKLNDPRACQRVIKYLSNRFVWPDEPLTRSAAIPPHTRPNSDR